MKKQLLNVGRLNLVTAAFLSIAGVTYSQTITDSLNFTGGIQSFTVPCGVTSITIDAYGAQGGSGDLGGAAAGGVLGGTGGLGGYASGTLTVTPGDVLSIFVGGAGATPTGGFNGGANGGSTNAGGGGGSTDVRVIGTAESDRILTAGGGGGGGRGGCEGSSGAPGFGGNGGNGGNTGNVGANGGDSPTSGGVAGGGQGGNFGAVQGALGAAGAGCGGFLGGPGSTASTGTGAGGGAGQSCCCFSNSSIPGGGGGGGGQLGGGGGGGGSAGTTGCSGNDKGAGGGGGGGSSYNGGMTVAGTITDGVRTGNGVVMITYNDPTPVATLSSPVSQICAGDTVNYTATSTNNPTSYTWTTSGGLTILSGQGTSSIDLVSAGISDTIFVYATTVCGDGPTTSFVVNTNALPVVTISATATEVCEGGSTTLSGNGADASYTWDNGIVDGVSFVPNATATYTVTGTDSTGCSNTASQEVIVNPLPVVALTATQMGTVCGGQDITLTGTPAGGSYTEISGPATALTGNIFNAPSQGMWVVDYDYTDANGCSGTDQLTFVVDCMLGLEMIGTEGSMNVYPNPTNGNFTVTSKANINGTIQLFNDLGQLVFEQAVNGVNKKQLDIKNLTPGTYQLKITSDNQVFSGKLNVVK